MNLQYASKLSWWFCCVFLLTTCTNDTKFVEEGLVFDNRPLTHSFDTEIGYCFQRANTEIEERYELSIKGNRLIGNGTRLKVKNQQATIIKVLGQISGSSVKVELTSHGQRSPNLVQTTYEYWEIDTNQLTVSKQKEVNELQYARLLRTNCTQYNNKDTTKFDTFSGFFEGYAVVSKNGLYGLMNEKMELTIPYQYADLGVVNEGSIVYYDKVSGRKGLLDVNGKQLVAPEYAEIHCFNAGLAAFLNEDGLWGFMNKALEIVIEPQYMGMNFFLPDPNRHPFNEGLANVQKQNQKWIYINTKGEVRIQGDFLFAEAFVAGKARVFKNNKWYYIDPTGQCVADCDK
jgi:hypothetical protein